MGLWRALAAATSLASVWLLVGACARGGTTTESVSWVQSGGDAGHTGLAPLAGPRDPDVVWSWELPPEEDADAYPPASICAGPLVAADGTVYVISGPDQARLWAVAADGSLRWRMPLGRLDAARGSCRFVLGKGAAPTILAGGRLARVNPCGAIESAPEASGSALLVGPDSATYIDGARVTVPPLPQESFLPPGAPVPPPACSVMAPDGTVYVSDRDTHASSAGRQVSCVRATGADSATRTPIELEGIAGALAVAPDGTVVVRWGGSVSAHGNTGKRLWHFGAPEAFEGGMALGPGGVTHVACRTHVYALDQTGKIAWDRNFDASGIGQGALLVDPDGSLYVRLGHQVFAANARGKLKWVVPFPDVSDSPGAFGANDGAATDIAMAAGGRLYACSARRLYAIE